MVRNPPANAGDTGSIPESERSPGGGNSNPLQYSCLGNLMDRGGWWATVHGGHKVRYNLAAEHSHKNEYTGTIVIGKKNVCIGGPT